MIELIHDVVNLLVRQHIQGQPLGTILSNQSIGVLVEPPLPGMVGMGEIHRRFQRLADC